MAAKSLREALRTSQLDLPLGTSWEQRYRKWIEANPQVLKIAEGIAIEAIARQHRLSSGMVVELIRWRAPDKWEKDEAGFRINQSYASSLMRDLVRLHPALRALVEFRGLRSV